MVSLTTVKQMVPSSLRGVATGIWRRTAGRRYPRRSWSQGGEDLVLADLMSGRSTGTYVDVGAFHPRWGSNTYLLYEQGWSGINIDARPGSMAAFRRRRRRDTNLEVGVGAAPGHLDFYVFVDDELSTFDPDLAEQRQRRHRLVERTRVEVRTLDDILSAHLPGGVDLLLVDAEGYDLDVLRSNDWSRFRPSVVLVEALDDGAWSPDHPVTTYMRSVGYEVRAASAMNVFFVPAS